MVRDAPGHKPMMRALYNAAGSVFALPDYEQVLAYRDGGPEPEPPDCVRELPAALMPSGFEGMPAATPVCGGMDRRGAGRSWWRKTTGAVNFQTRLRMPLGGSPPVLQYLRDNRMTEFVILVGFLSTRMGSHR